MSLAVRSARNFVVQILSFVVTLADRMILTALFIRLWGVQAFADWATLLAATGLLATADLGFQTYLGTLLTRAERKRTRRAFDRVIAQSLVYYVGLALILLVGCAAIALSFDLRSLFHLGSQNMSGVFFLLACQQTLRITRSAITQIYRGKGEFHRYLWTDVRTIGASVALTIGALLLGASPLEVAALYLLCEVVIGTGWAIVHVRRRYPSVSVGWRTPSRQVVRRTGMALRWYALFQILSYAMLNLPVLIIASLGLGGPVLAMFVVQRTLVNVSRTVGATLSSAAGVELASAAMASTHGGYQTGVETLARINAALAALISAGLVVFGDEIVGFWTGLPELGSLQLLAWLLLPIIIVAPATPLQMLSLYGDHLRPQAASVLTQALIGLPAAVLAGMHFGIIGVAAALAVAEVFGMGIVAPLLTARRLHIHYGRLVGVSFAVFAAALVWVGGVAVLIQGVDAGPGALGLLLKLLAWGVVGGAPVAWYSLPRAVRGRFLGYAFRAIYGRRNRL